MGKYVVKRDCFAFDKDNFECTALKELFCANEKCKFYRNKLENNKLEKKYREKKLKRKYFLSDEIEAVYVKFPDQPKEIVIKNTLKDFKEYLECDKISAEPCPELGNVMVLFDKDKQAKKREREINVVSASGKIIYGNVLIVSSLLDSDGNSKSLTKEEVKNILIKIKSK